MSLKAVLKAVFLTLLASLVPVAAIAQYQSWTPPPLSTLGYVNGMVYGETWERENRAARELQRQSSQSIRPPVQRPTKGPTPKFKSNTPPTVRSGPTSTQTVAALTFTPSLSQRRTTLELIAADYTRANPRSGPEIRRVLLEQGDIIEKIGPSIRPYGFQTNNLADAYSIFWITAWEVSQGIVDSETPRSQAQAVRAQSVEILTSIPLVARLTPSEKQNMAEVFLVQAAIMESQSSRVPVGSPERPTFEASARRLATSMGFDVTVLTLTPTGFAYQN